MINFVQTVFKFYAPYDFREQLLHPENSKKADVVFQNAFANLLSFVGCSVINLGKTKYESIETKTGYHIASTDLIAYYAEGGKMCFVDCTTSAVDEPKIRALQQTINSLSSIEERSQSKVFGLIPSPRDCSDIKRQYWEDINIIDKSDLERILTFINEGKIEDARKSFF